MFLSKYIFKPIISIGVSYNYISLTRNNIEYIYSAPAKDNYVQIDEMVWEYNLIKSSFGSLGISPSVGFSIKISDFFGIIMKYQADIITQNKSDFIGERIISHSFNFGVSTRILKPKLLTFK